MACKNTFAVSFLKCFGRPIDVLYVVKIEQSGYDLNQQQPVLLLLELIKTPTDNKMEYIFCLHSFSGSSNEETPLAFILKSQVNKTNHTMIGALQELIHIAMCVLLTRVGTIYRFVDVSINIKRHADYR